MSSQLTSVTNSDLKRLVQAAFLAKSAIDQVHDQTSLDTAYQAVSYLAHVAVETPAAIQLEAQAAEPGIPVLEGLLRELLAATTQVAADAESVRIANAS